MSNFFSENGEFEKVISNITGDFVIVYASDNITTMLFESPNEIIVDSFLKSMNFYYKNADMPMLQNEINLLDKHPTFVRYNELIQFINHASMKLPDINKAVDGIPAPGEVWTSKTGSRLKAEIMDILKPAGGYKERVKWKDKSGKIHTVGLHWFLSQYKPLKDVTEVEDTEPECIWFAGRILKDRGYETSQAKPDALDITKAFIRGRK